MDEACLWAAVAGMACLLYCRPEYVKKLVRLGVPTSDADADAWCYDVAPAAGVEACTAARLAAEVHRLQSAEMKAVAELAVARSREARALRDLRRERHSTVDRAASLDARDAQLRSAETLLKRIQHMAVGVGRKAAEDALATQALLQAATQRVAALEVENAHLRACASPGSSVTSDGHAELRAQLAYAQTARDEAELDAAQARHELERERLKSATVADDRADEDQASTEAIELVVEARIQEHQLAFAKALGEAARREKALVAKLALLEGKADALGTAATALSAGDPAAPAPAPAAGAAPAQANEDTREGAWWPN